MRVATRANGHADGELVLVSSGGERLLPVGGRFATLLAAKEQWDEAEREMQGLAAQLEAGEGDALDPGVLLAPLPRAWQWLDGSAFPQHGELMQRAFDLPPIETDRPLMYQGMSDHFLPGHADVPLPSGADGIDFEGEFGVITDAVPMGTCAEEAMKHIKLILLINDWSLRTIAPIEMKTGFGWVQAKPACSAGPLAVTPDELGDAWKGGKVHLTLEVRLNGQWFGNPHGGEMALGFHELIAHAARTRHLAAGSIIGSGTVSNASYANVGSACISERRAIEMIASGTPATPFLRFGDRVQMQVPGNHFGALDQRVMGARQADQRC